ncbi:MAG: KUP/HAK/KT family potassium transporter [Flavobacteriales bacterium]
MASHSHKHMNKVTFGGLIVTLGIIYGDIGTSPLYVLKAIVGDGPITEQLVLGAISCIFWTLTLQTTVKYVLLTLKADNKGEGGIFSLYTLVRRRKAKWLLIPAIIGGSALLADGIITPPISVAAAVEGLSSVNPYFSNADGSINTDHTIWVVLGIITALFAIQQFGTKFVGRFFGPVMLIWFSMLGILGISQMTGNIGVLKAINPYYAYDLLTHHPGGFWLLGAVFLCTTGAEALYSDLGHCGRSNVRITWIGVKTALLLNYFGQGAWLLNDAGKTLDGRNPFYAVMPEWFLPAGIAIATAAAIVASQALISGSFTLINEAMRLNIWPKSKIKYPTDLRGQLFIPSVNTMMWAGCMLITIYFRESANMEAAYGLAIILCMIMTTILLANYLIIKRYPVPLVMLLLLLYLFIEGSFLAANLKKFSDGGWITLLIAAILVGLMLIYHEGKKIRRRYVEFVKIEHYKELIAELSVDMSIPKYATHLVYMTSANRVDEIERKVIYSIFENRPKRADLYWFVHVDVVDEPYKMEYKINHLQTQDIIRVDFKLGFRMAPRINLMFKKVAEDLLHTGEVDVVSRYESLNKKNVIGDFRFVVIDKFMSIDNDLPVYEKIITDIYEVMKKMSLSEDRAFGLDGSNVVVEKFPIIVAPPKDLKLLRTDTDDNRNGDTNGLKPH